MINIDVNIYCDIQTLLTGQKINILEKVQEQMQQKTDYYNEYIIDELCDYYSDFSELYNHSYLSFSDYISIKEKEIYFDGEETKTLNSSKMISFLVPCDFDEEKYINDLKKEYEEFLEKDN